MELLSEPELEALKTKHGKIGVIDWDGHQLVFRRPTREHVRDYRRKQDSAAEKADSMDQLAQQTLVAFDGEEDVNKARAHFTSIFLEEYPAFTSNSRVVNVLSALTGIIADEEATELGKGASVRRSHPKSTPTVSPNGSAPAFEAKS